jgi:ABC-type multidrug transport system fused ATPase/permease subunit
MPSPSESTEPTVTLSVVRHVLTRLWKFIRPYQGKFYLGLAMVLLAVPLSQLAVFLTRDVTNNALTAVSLTAEDRWAVVLRIVGLQAIFWLSASLLSMWREVLEWYVSMKATFDLRLHYYRHLMKLPMSHLSRFAPGEHLFRATSDMVSMFTIGNKVETATPAGQLPPENKEVRSTFFYSNDVDPYDPGIMGIISRSLPLFLETLYGLGWGFGLLWLIDPVLSIALACYIVPFYLVSDWAFNKVRKSAFGFKAATEVESGVLRDSIAGLRVLKSFGRTGVQKVRFYQAASIARRRGVRMMFDLALTQQGAQQGMRWAFTTCVYLYQARRIVQGEATVGDWIATALLVESAQMPLQNMVQLVQLVRMQMVPAQRVLETLDTEPTLLDKPNAVAMGPLRGEVVFDDVHLSYNGERTALNGVSFRVKPGEYVGIVGPSGAGKSSVLALLLRLYGADKGSVRVDGLDVLDVQLDTFLDQTATVPQSTALYSGSILENVLFGNPRAEFDQLDWAIEAAGVKPFADQRDEGLDTEIGDGSFLSGGERQRIGIARALVRNPKLLLLDEATASLDPKTEDDVLQVVERLREGRTVISIAHRLKAVVPCDRIIVLDQGRVVAEGTHHELVDRPGPYRDLWRVQQEELGLEVDA